MLAVVTNAPAAYSAKSGQDPLSRDRRITKSARLAPVDSCRSSDATPTNGMDLSQTRTASLGFPRPTTTGSSTSLNIAVLPLSFSDLPYRESDHSALRDAMREFKKYFEAMSYGRAVINYQVIALADAVTMPGTARSYGAFGEDIDLERVIRDSLTRASSTLGLASYDMVALEMARNESVKIWPVAYTNSIETPSGRVGGAVLAGGWQGANWRAIAHEVGHVWLGLEDLYDMSPPPQYDGTFWEYDLMNSFRGSAPELTAWNRFLLGWLDDTQVRCISSTTPRKTTHYLSAISDRNALPKMVARSLSSGRTLVLESRRNRGYDKLDDSVLVYIVDSTRRSGDGPIEAKAELTLNKNRRPRQDRYVIPVGSSVRIEGVTIRLKSSSKWGDLVEVTLR
jgi:M6 family metalloprotease-like protein